MSIDSYGLRRCNYIMWYFVSLRLDVHGRRPGKIVAVYRAEGRPLRGVQSALRLHPAILHP